MSHCSSLKSPVSAPSASLSAGTLLRLSLRKQERFHKSLPPTISTHQPADAFKKHGCEGKERMEERIFFFKVMGKTSAHLMLTLGASKKGSRRQSTLWASWDGFLGEMGWASEVKELGRWPSQEWAQDRTVCKSGSGSCGSSSLVASNFSMDQGKKPPAGEEKGTQGPRELKWAGAWDSH